MGTAEKTRDTGSTVPTLSPLRHSSPRLSFPPLAARGGAGGSLSAPPAMPGVPLPFVLLLLLLAGSPAGGFPRDLVARSTVGLAGERGSGGARGPGGGRGVTVSLPVRSHRRVPALRGPPGGQRHGPARPRLPADAAAQRDAARGCPVSAAGLAGARSCVPGHASSVSVLERPDLCLCKDLHTRTAWSLLVPPPLVPSRAPCVTRQSSVRVACPRVSLHTPVPPCTPPCPLAHSSPPPRDHIYAFDLGRDKGTLYPERVRETGTATLGTKRGTQGEGPRAHPPPVPISPGSTSPGRRRTGRTAPCGAGGR